MITTQQPLPSPIAINPVGFTTSQSKWLDCIITALRSGRINDIALRHLEVDGVLQLDPLVELAALEPCPESAG